VRPAGAVGGEGGTTLPLDDYAVSEGASPCVGYCIDGGLYIMFDISPMAPNEYHQKTARIPRSG
jgi:hypothetical protein